MAMVNFQKVCKYFGDTAVLRDFDFTVAAGEKVAILGRSGSGKSTLLRIVMALETIDRGRVSLDGETLWDPAAGGRAHRGGERRHIRHMRAKVGMVFQQFNLFPHMTAIENVAAAPRHVLGIEAGKALDLARELLAQVGLADRADHYPAALSGGQQQRVAIARALALEPKIMLFDEATSALDPELVSEVLDVMRSLAHERSLTMLVVTHQLGVARAIADRVCFMDEGRILEEGPPDEFFGSPRNERTRAFLSAVQLT
ncbi:Polar amino acid transport system ATP-binding protein OS=Castellaniella defragrans OX=75697 GN=HNR28_000824 PE=3 SV=1 [Castellaniella defragrans]